MAGSYPDVPASRIPWDINGAVCLYLNTTATAVNSVVTTPTTTNVADDIGTSLDIPNRVFCIVLPHAFDITALFVQCAVNVWGPIQWSTNTTNGVDGTWTTSGATRTVLAGDNPVTSRNAIQTVNFPACVGFRFFVGGSGADLSYVHLYGAPTVGANLDRLALWNPTTDTPITDGAYFDWDDLRRYDMRESTFRIKNLSSTLTANDVLIGAVTDTRTGAAPSFGSQHTFSVNDSAFSTTASLGTLVPSQASSVVTVRYYVNATASLSLWFGRMIATASSWS